MRGNRPSGDTETRRTLCKVFDAAIASAAGFEAREARYRHDSYNLLGATKDLIKAGPTLTNVNDSRIVMVSD